MSATTVQNVDITSVLEELLSTVDGLRVYRYVADNFRPPGAVISMPRKDYVDADAGFCSATWFYAVTIIVSRSSERVAQDELCRLEAQAAGVLNTADVDGVFSIGVTTSDPLPSVSVAGQDLPAYSLEVRVRA